MPIGPLEYMVIGCPANQFASEIVPELNSIQEKGLIQVVDLLCSVFRNKFKMPPN